MKRLRFFPSLTCRSLAFCQQTYHFIICNQQMPLILPKDYDLPGKKIIFIKLTRYRTIL